MRPRFAAFLVAALLIPSSATVPAPPGTPTILVLVRHAEKALDGSADPGLTETGRRRAEDLARALSPLDIRAVYATPYERTRRTAAPTAGRKGLPILDYAPGDEPGFVAALLTRHAGEVVLVVGHSNTVPRLANAAAGREAWGDLPDSAYDDLFVAVSCGPGPAAVCRLKYGPASPTSPGGPVPGK